MSLFFDSLFYVDDGKADIANGIGGAFRYRFPSAYVDVGVSYGINDICAVNDRIQFELCFTWLFS